MSRAEHLRWAKDRALEYVERGDLTGAQASMASDVSKHPGTAGHAGVEMWMLQVMAGHLRTPGEVREFIEGFN